MILAAGGSRRLGRPKALLLRGGTALVRRAACCALDAGFAPVLVVVGDGAAAVRREVADLPVGTVVNRRWRQGLAQSIRHGMSALPDGARGVALVVCDQPRLSAAILRRLRVKFDERRGRMVACAYAGTIGVPAIFPRSRFAELSALSGDVGAKQVLLAHPAALALVRWSAGAVDVDTPADADALER